MKQTILLSHNFINIPDSKDHNPIVKTTGQEKYLVIGTLLNNLAYYGYMLSGEAFAKIQTLSKHEIGQLWNDIEPSLKDITGANRNMEQFVVYKNFPNEVLEMSQAEYWIKQAFMYFGFANEYFTQTEEVRLEHNEKNNLKVLSLSSDNTLHNIFDSLLKNTARWTVLQKNHAEELIELLSINSLDVSTFNFKENAISLIKYCIETHPKSINISIHDATDVLRLAIALSNGDISLRQKSKIKNFKRSERKLFLMLLNNSNNLLADISLRPEMWKKFLVQLHPGDYNFTNVTKAYDSLYNKKYQTFNSTIENGIINNDHLMLKFLSQRPGEFVRRFHKVYNVFGKKAITAFVKIMPQLKVSQLLKLNSYLLTINSRHSLIFPPRGNWNRAQLVDNVKNKIQSEDIILLTTKIQKQIGQRINSVYPQGFKLDSEINNIKLQTNDQELATYGRGTVFSIPENIQFIRTASYWAQKSNHNTWFDNGWNFFNENWQSIGTCCWNATTFDGATFSGDPTNSKELKGRACQMIDLDINTLLNNGVRYAVWNILCYSNIPFSEAEEVLATMQMGEDPQKGNLYEPNRANFVFPVTGDNKTKYIAYLDLLTRQIVYMDANLYGSVSSAILNSKSLEKMMPAFVEYLETLPSVFDLFSCGKRGTIPIVYSDKDIDIIKESTAYVFKPENDENTFEKIDIHKLLEL